MIFAKRIALLLLLSVAWLGAGGETAARIYCTDSGSPAATEACLHARLQDAQAQLNRKFEDAKTQAAKAGTVETLREAQKSWLTYRDATCADADKACLIRLTEQRTRFLGMPYGHRDIYAAQWQAVAARAAPQAYWQTGKTLIGDLDCMEGEEAILSGLEPKPIDAVSQGTMSGGNGDDGDEEAAPHSPFALDAVFAVGAIGKDGAPTATLFRLPVAKRGNDPHICMTEIIAERLELPGTADDVPETEGAGENGETCPVYVRIGDPVCAPVYLHWNGLAYELLDSLP